MAPPQRFSTSLLVLFTTLLAFASAQQGVLASGNTQLPACAQQCALLNQAAQACDGETTASTTAWNCFCQSGYLKTLYTSPTGICDTSCTDATDNQNVMTWYKSNCGTDNGASEHANGGAAPSSTTTTASPSTTTSAAPSASTSKSAGSVSNTGAATAIDESGTDSSKPWIDTHYQWIIFVVVVIVGFGLITVFAVWYKRRYIRKRDQINGAFNTGVSDQAPPMSNAAYNNSGNLTGPSNTVASSLRARDSGRFA